MSPSPFRLTGQRTRYYLLYTHDVWVRNQRHYWHTTYISISKYIYYYYTRIDCVYGDIARCAMCRQFSRAIVCWRERRAKRNEERNEKAARRYVCATNKTRREVVGCRKGGKVGGRLRCANAIKSGMCVVRGRRKSRCVFSYMFVVLGAAHDIAFNSN